MLFRAMAIPTRRLGPALPASTAATPCDGSRMPAAQDREKARADANQAQSPLLRVDKKKPGRVAGAHSGAASPRAGPPPPTRTWGKTRSPLAAQPHPGGNDDGCPHELDGIPN